MNMLTDDEGQHDLGYVIWALGTVVFLVLACVNYSKFDAGQFGTGFGLMLGAGGTMTWLRQRAFNPPEGK